MAWGYLLLHRKVTLRRLATVRVRLALESGVSLPARRHAALARR
jgi:hypothetical protein